MDFDSFRCADINAPGLIRLEHGLAFADHVLSYAVVQREKRDRNNKESPFQPGNGPTEVCRYKIGITQKTSQFSQLQFPTLCNRAFRHVKYETPS